MSHKYLSYRRLAGAPSAFSRYADSSLAAAGLTPWSSSSRSRGGSKLNATRKEATSWSTIQGRWGSYRFAARRRWDKLSEEQLHGTRGQREQLAKRLQQAYLLTREEADRQICAWQVQILLDSAGR